MVPGIFSFKITILTNNFFEFDRKMMLILPIFSSTFGQMGICIDGVAHSPYIVVYYVPYVYIVVYYVYLNCCILCIFLYIIYILLYIMYIVEYYVNCLYYVYCCI